MVQSYRVTGLMSGSSLDGVDLALVEFLNDQQGWDFNILAAETLPYPGHLKAKLEQASHWSPTKISDLDKELGFHFAALLNNFHNRHQPVPDLIASHGHTILHDPHRGITLQAGQGDIIAKRTGIKVVNDFRSEDVAQGGQGAPLVPVGDRLLFGAFEGCLNLGGFANISYEGQKSKRIAYDLCPANMALNWIAGLKGLEFDRDGLIGRKGQVDQELLEVLNSIDYYKEEAPKSLGREWFLNQFLPLINTENLHVFDLMATVLEHIAIQIATGINGAGINSLLVTGGGVLNKTLMERLTTRTPAHIEIPDIELVHFKEALIFALLGLLRIRNEVNCFASVTGGRKDLSAGTIHII